MSTRAQIRFATRKEGVSFSDHPNAIHAQFYVHSDGYPEGLGVEIAESFTKYGKIDRWEIEDLTTKHGDLEYIYYIWQKPDDTTWISIFEMKWLDYCRHCGNVGKQTDECIFVGTPEKLINKYKQKTNNDG
tara:strand:+ start:216 stop:608 length:393 start_codon:yes stop_codon:yes gene_type:complete